jgi:hypothetical protein
MKKIEQFLVKLKELFLAENAENQKMLDTYIKFAEGRASEDELARANDQLAENFKNLGLGVLVVLPFSPITIPYIFKKAHEYKIDIVPKWYKDLTIDKKQ